MRAVVQRVKRASVTIDGEKVADICQGIMALVGFKDTDTPDSFNTMLDKLLNLRIFEDENGKMNLSLLDISGELLIVPNFTLYGDCRHGRRPSYSQAAKPQDASSYFTAFVKGAKEAYDKVQSGVFQADMAVELINDGPVTLLIDSDKTF